MTTRYLTVDEAARILRVHPETVRRLIRHGDVAAVRVGSLLRIDPSELDRHLASTTTTRTAA